MIRQGICAGLLGTAIWLVAPGQAAAQSCTNSGDTTVCTIALGTYSSGISLNDTSGDPFQVNAAGTMTVPASTQQNSALSFTNDGPWGTSSNTQGANAAGLTIGNIGSITLTPTQGQNPINNYLFGLYSRMTGGDGYNGNPDKNQTLNGGSAAQLILSNSSAITIELPNVQIWSGGALYALSQGGNGGSNGSDTGGAGGTTGGAVISNSGAISASLAGQYGFGGIEALGRGGSAGTGDNGAIGGDGGVSTVANSAPVTVTWNWQNADSINYGLFGILAQSVGGTGTGTKGDLGSTSGGYGGNAQSASVTLTQDGNVAVTETGSSPAGGLGAGLAANITGAGVVAEAIGGNGGNGEEQGDPAGNGGNAASAGVTIDVTDANVVTSGNGLPGLLAIGQGGAGGLGATENNGDNSNSAYSNGGYGGSALDAATVDVTALTQRVQISTAGAYSPAIVALMQGGAGGDVNPSAHIFKAKGGGDGGRGGNVYGTDTITLAGTGGNTVGLTTTGDHSPGIYALSLGGAGGAGGNYTATLGGGTGGNGGNGGEGWLVTVGLQSASISTQGQSSPGIVAQSQGAAGGQGGSAYAIKNGGGNGGAGGASGAVTVSLDSASAITTQGADSSGIMAQSLSGAGGDAGPGNGEFYGAGGNGGTGGAAGNVTVTNAGAVSTLGANSRGILAQSMAGVGGGGAEGFGSVFGEGGTGGSSGTVGSVTIINSGTITTRGTDAEGILAQSIGGSGGAGGSGGGVITAVGGNADTNPFASNAAEVVINNDFQGGSITTSGVSAIGILGQSIGGGGGDGGGATGAVSVGASGGGGGSGALVTTELNGATITTSGDGAHGIVLQSIGGGGGNAGNASGTGPFASVAIGGSGAGGGGAGGSVVANAFNTTITTSGSKAAGLVAQSIGGGGGTGGAAFAGSVGAGFSASVAVGGSGGEGGTGGAAQSTVTGGLIATGQNPLLVNGGTTSQGPCPSLPCNLLPVDDYGVVVQSVGGGGGLGGSATAQSVAVSVPLNESTQVAVATSVAIGGTAGKGGNGGNAEFALSDGGLITTSGQGSTAVLAQSIGGGGGAGGDSSALAAAVGPALLPKDTTSVNLSVTVALGGSGATGGNGGTVNVVLGGTISSGVFSPDASGSAPTSIVTYGDFGDGITAQSIGGGGGNGGFGSGNTQAFGAGSDVTVNVSLGGTGSGGGTGGPVAVQLYRGNGITTYGSGAVGVVAQSIGGGGGSSQGDAFAIGIPYQTSTGVAQFDLGLGGAAGGAGGSVAVAVEAPITTHGGDATGVLAQSIGGGGGLGGSAGSDASADNPIVAGLGARQALSNFANFWEKLLEQENGAPFAGTFTLAIGGKGGPGADGGAVTVNIGSLTTVNTPITTTGDWADGVVAQSIGGGGGKGGSAAATGTGGIPSFTINHDIAVGGNGGGGGNGGAVLVNLNQGSALLTTGFGAAGVIAQSIGGGGGIGADGSDSATGLLSVGAGAGGSGGVGGGGGTVNVLYYNPNATSIATAGQAADGVVLQSVGGGGGIAGAGSSVFVGAFRQAASLTLSAGGGSSASGAGNTVTFGPQGGYDTPLHVLTAGNESYGIVAQSIGGGGGIVTSQPSGSSVNPTLGGTSNPSGNSGGNGGAVSVTLLSQSTIATTGIGAHGIVAQSIGGGGGVIRVVNSAGDTPALTTAVPAQYGSNYSTLSASGAGGAVTIEDNGSVSVTGAGSIGILAQSVGGGGGLIADGGLIYAGSPNAGAICPCSYDAGGAVSVTTNGPISATGANGIGIFAQSTGLKFAPNGPVSITVNSSVIGGSGPGATYTSVGSSAVVIDSPAHSQAGQVIVNSGGSLETLSGTNGTAILASGGGYANVTNNGTVTGSVYLNGGTMSNAETYNTGPVMQGNLGNSGTVNLGIPGARPPQTTVVTGEFTQTGTGSLVVTIDSINKANSQLQVDGTASVFGLIVPSAITLLPGSYTVLTAGGLNSSAGGQNSLLFNWNAAPSGNTLTLSPSSNFAPSSVSLTASQSSLAGYLTRAWNNSDAAFATRFAALSQLNNAGRYATILDAYSGKAIEAQSIALANSAGVILSAAMSCPVFVDQSVLLGEDNCVWVKASGRWSNQWATGDIQGYHVAGATYRLGGQHAIAPDWYLGGSFAAGQTWATTNGTANGSSSGYGQTYDGSVALKHTMGPWYFAGSVALASGAFHSARVIDLPGESGTLQSDPSIFLAGGRMRMGYEFTFDNWYIRPYGDLDVFYTHLSGFQESGPALLALNVRGNSKTSVAVSPMVEFGGRVVLDDTTTLRPFAAVGVSILPNNTRTIDASFVGASTDDGTFRSFLNSPGVLGDFELGVQVYRAGGFEVKAEYEANIGGSFVSQGASARLAYHF
jgi:hypothetical protein